MSLQFKKSVGRVACATVGHVVSEEEENKLYVRPLRDGIREMESVCERCRAKLLLKVDPTDEDSYFVTEI